MQVGGQEAGLWMVLEVVDKVLVVYAHCPLLSPPPLPPPWVGVERLVDNKSFTAAFPLHDVSLKIVT